MLTQNLTTIREISKKNTFLLSLVMRLFFPGSENLHARRCMRTPAKVIPMIKENGVWVGEGYAVGMPIPGFFVWDPGIESLVCRKNLGSQTFTFSKADGSKTNPTPKKLF